jgi:hypothetical protein
MSNLSLCTQDLILLTAVKPSYLEETETCNLHEREVLGAYILDAYILGAFILDAYILGAYIFTWIKTEQK